MCLLSWNVWVFFLILWSSPDTVDLLETFHRSLCTLVCKWTYCPPDGWDAGFWSSIGLEDLLENNFSKIGKDTNKQSYYYVLREFREFRKYSLCVVIFSKHVIYTRVLISLFKLCRAVPCFPGSATCSPGSPLGGGLTQDAAADLSLEAGTAVGASLIDAHAGGLGILY